MTITQIAATLLLLTLVAAALIETVTSKNKKSKLRKHRKVWKAKSQPLR